VVEPDAGGEREQFGGDPGSDAMEGAGVVAFEPEPVFKSPEDRFDALADRRELRPATALGLAVGAQDQRTVALGDRGAVIVARNARAESR
jgi:hypothetical protein